MGAFLLTIVDQWAILATSTRHQDVGDSLLRCENFGNFHCLGQVTFDLGLALHESLGAIQFPVRSRQGMIRFHDMDFNNLIITTTIIIIQAFQIPPLSNTVKTRSPSKEKIKSY
jgi:hypothetical protein